MNNLSVLLVDDSPVILKLLLSALEKWGYKVTATDSAEKALTIVENEMPNIVITDWMLPGMSGPSLCNRIRELNTPHYIYIMIITALEDANVVVEGIESGADDFLRKPINLQELRARLSSGVRIINLEEKLISQNRHLNAISSELIAAQSAIMQDLKLAEKIQKDLLPGQEVGFRTVDLHHLYCPSQYVSGDSLGYFSANEDILCFYMIDVSGHGIAAAMMSYAISKIISQLFESELFLNQSAGKQELFDNPHHFVGYLNKFFYNRNDYSLYFSMIFGFLNKKTNIISLCQAGHPHPLYLAHDGSTKVLGHGGFPVALLPQATYESISFSYQSGDRLIMYSDGVTECNNAGEEFFNLDSLRDFVDRRRREPLNEVFDELRNALVAWHGSEQFDDDISVLGLQIH